MDKEVLLQNDRYTVKEFPGVKGSGRRFSDSKKGGTVHALMGENGSW